MFWDRKGFREKKVKTLRTVKIRDFITDNGDDNDSTVKNNNSVRASHFLVVISWQSWANKQRENSSWEGVVKET